MKKIAILGSTGSIGRQTLDVVRAHPHRFQVVALAAGGRIPEVIEQATSFRPNIVSVREPSATPEVRAALDRSVRVVSGSEGLHAVAVESGADLVVAATDGAVAFDAVFAAVERGISIAVANKELIVAAGELFIAAARKSNAAILPVDSEHSAIFQCLVGEPKERIAKLILTASGGPFWTRDREAMHHITVADALQHPTWQMGMKNTIDSATLMNKGLEVIEASRLFGIPGDRIEVLVHRTSIVHAFVVFTDGNVKAQLAPPDMRLPIGYALAYPDRLPGSTDVDPLAAIGGGREAASTALGFERPDADRFPCLGLAYKALAQGGTAPAALSAANEIAVRSFVEGGIPFEAIPVVIEAAMDHAAGHELTLDAVREADRRARERAEVEIRAWTAATRR
ncbi:MAG TPA: 1-deoxy-D-xylulose-5-phosphate reductoisomerase [Candidatus Binatia bacterium]|nr:1-deoxy-D-xylulose-5-phosphate reductoisomerase [Candidatus Binatia bacterium]